MENLLDGEKGKLQILKAEKSKFYGNIFKRHYMIQKEGQYKGYPLRTFVGNNFQGGFSDHFPVYIYIVSNQTNHKFMKFKTLLFLLVSLLTVTAFAQTGGGIKGTVISRTTRAKIDNVKITLVPSDRTASTDDSGEFLFENVAPGEYELRFETAEFEDLTLPVRVGKNMREMRVIMVPANRQPVLDDAIFAEFDTETMDDAQSLPTSLSASKDVFNNIASYQFSEMRFNVRGYDSQFSDVYMNGIQLNDAMTGYTPWSLWSGLNDATRNQEVTTGLEMGEMGIGGIAGVTNINTRPSQMRKGLRASLVSTNSMYRFRGMLTYSSGMQDNGWSYAFSVSTRQGNNAYVNGVYYNAFGYFAAVEKQFNPQHRLSLTVLGAPTERGAQQASTQEAYDLVGNNYYNPNWGWQNGKRRNARVRDYHEPLAMLNIRSILQDRTQLNVATSLSFRTEWLFRTDMVWRSRSSS